MNRRRTVVALIVSSLVLVASSCSSLRDQEPWTATITYEPAPFGLAVPEAAKTDPRGLPLIEGDASFGEVQIVNNTGRKHAFSIDDLAVFEEIGSGKTKTILIEEAKDDTSYFFYCHLHPGEFKGVLKVNYLSEDERG